MTASRQDHLARYLYYGFITRCADRSETRELPGTVELIVRDAWMVATPEVRAWWAEVAHDALFWFWWLDEKDS